jgi:transcriptional regulator with XRE-family HTH domain
MAYKPSITELPQRLFQAWKAYEGRLSQRVTQGDLAELVGEGQPTVSDWLNGNRTPSLAQVVTIARVFGVSPGWIAFGEGVMLAGNHPPPKPMPPGHLTRVDSKRRKQQ